MNLEAVSKALVRSALATEGGDPDAAAEASVHLIELVDEAQEDPARSLQVLHFLMDVCTRSPASSELRALLGAVCLEVVPRLLALADLSPAAAAAAGQLTEAVLAAQGCCSPRELVMALMELYDSHKDSAFVPGSGSVHLLLLGLLRGTLPSLVAAVQRRRLKVAFSMLQAVVDLAAGAGRQLLRLTDLTAAAAAAAAAAAGDDGGGAEAGGNSAASGGEVAEALREQAAEAAASLVEPFVEFAEQLHRKVLSKELLPRASATITTAKSDALADHGDRSDRSKVGAWLLALLGALWPAWASMDAALSFTPLIGGGAAARPAGTPATGSGALGSAAEAAAARLAGLLPFYLPPPPVWSPAAAVGMEEAGTSEGSSAAIHCDSGALGVSWEGLWAAAQAGAPLPREPTCEGEDQGDGYDGGFDGPEEWTLSDPQLARLGAAVVVWLDVCGGYSSRGGSNRRVSSVGLTGFAQAAAVSAAGCAARLPDGFLPCVPPADSEVASLYLLRFIEAHMDASLGGSGVDGGGGEAGNGSSGGSSGHTEPLARALAMISAASLRLQLQRQQWHLSALVPTDAIAGTASADVRSSWEALAGHLGAEDTTTEGRAGAAAALQCTSGTERASWGSGSGTGGQVEEAVTAAAALLPLVTDAQRAMLPLARRAAQRLLLCMDCAGSEVLRRQCHDSWQALLSLLPPAVRAAVLHHQATALGSTPTVRSIVLQRLQREVASATAAAAQAQAAAAAVTPPAGPTAQGAAPQPGAQGPTGGMRPAMVAAFGGPWVLRPVVHSLQALQRQADATTYNAAVTPGGGGSVPPVPVSRATDGLVAVGAVLDNADATVAALSVLRFMALRYAAAGSDSPQAPAVEPRLAVLRAVQRHVVAPLRPLVSRVLGAMQREAAEAEQAATAAAAAAVAGDAMAAQLSAAVTAAAAAAGDRFAGNVAVLSGALSGLTGVSRVAELLDYLQELLG